MIDSLQLGPFRLDEHVGAGGVGAVYRAEHTETGEFVAIKVLLADVARQPKKQRDFRREVQALAKLHHPAIASVLDYGTIGTQTARRGPDSFVAGAPWFAMEYVDGEPVPKGSRDWHWESLKSVLLTTLDGLAHAHARSIVHRDLKPGNVLLETNADGDREPRLVDFGIARIFDPDATESGEQSSRVTGTPKYMAPEQIRGQWRDQGPWTDLYALGCMTYRIVCDAPAFDGETTEEVLKEHLHKRPSKFEPRMAVPEGFEDWVRGLIRTKIDHRTGHPADAARQLLQLGPPRRDDADDVVSAPHDTRAANAVQPTLRAMAETLDSRPSSSVEPTREEPTGAADRGPSHQDDARAARRPSHPQAGTSPDPPPISSDWRRGNAERTAAVVPKAGLELFALREVPVVDRDEERDRLWQALRRVDARGEPHLLALEAGAGTGKSRLAQWLCRRARETGAADVLRAPHSASSAPDAGLRNMIQSAYRTRGLDRDAVHERLLRQLPALPGSDGMRMGDARALTEFLRPTDDDGATVDGPRYRFSDPDHKFGVIRRLFRRLAAARPLIVWFDDLHWGPQSIGLLDELFTTSANRPPVLAVATVRSDLLAEMEQLDERFDELCGRADAERIELSPLGADDHRALIDRLLHLTDDLADALAARTEGNPLFATQLLRELVEGGRLEATPEGFALPSDEPLEPPEDVHSLWLRRLDRFIRGLEEEDETVWGAVEIAATLGRNVDRGEWRFVCDRLDLRRPDVLEDGLIQRGLAERTDQGWKFTHGMLVDSLERNAREHDRLELHHSRCAEWLGDLYPEEPGETAARRADHWIGAGEVERALEPLLVEAQRLEELGAFHERKRVLERRGALLDSLVIPEDDPRRIENDLELAWFDVFLGSEPDAVLARLEELRRRAERAECERLVARAWICIARCRGQTGKSKEVVEAAREASRWARRSGEATIVFEGVSEWGWAEYVLGNLEEAETQFLEAESYAGETGDHYRLIDSKYGLAWVALSRGDEDRASTLFEEVLEASRTAGYRGLEAHALNGLGDMARFQGDVEEARTRYRRFGELQREMSRPGDVAISTLNRTQVELLDGAFASAEELLQRAERQLEAVSRREQWTHLIRVSRLVHAAGVGDWSRFDDLLSHYAEGWPEAARVVKDHAWLLEMAGDYAAEHDETERAHSAWSLARDLWNDLGDEDAAARVAERLDT